MLSRRAILGLVALAAGASAGTRPEGPATALETGMPGTVHPDRLAELAARLARMPFGSDWRQAAVGLGTAATASASTGESAGLVVLPVEADAAWTGLTDVYLVDPANGAVIPATSPQMGAFELSTAGTALATRFEFRGATVFRLARDGDVYGAAARGLGIRTADPLGEEFPVFRAIWIETPKPGSPVIRLRALLDSPSTTGAYLLDLRPALSPVDAVTVEIEATLTPRADIASVGIGPLSAGYLFSAGDGRDIDDWRPAVRDASGLMMLNGRGERLWRPLANPRALQISAFEDPSPRAFGLVQRDRRFASYQDPAAGFERRPSLVVEPIGDWGRGWVTLVEIPSTSEANDNVIAFWRPEAPLAAGVAHRFTWRLSTRDDLAAPHPSALVAATRSGAADGGNGRVFAIDYRLADPDLADRAKAAIWASSGEVEGLGVERLPDGLVRTRFTVRRDGFELVELRADLFFDDAPPAEVWLQRWV